MDCPNSNWRPERESNRRRRQKKKKIENWDWGVLQSVKIIAKKSTWENDSIAMILLYLNWLINKPAKI